MMTILSWLFAGVASAERALALADKEIEEKQSSIVEMEKGIEAAKPIVEEAIKRTDDVYYKLRSEVKRAARRKDKTLTDLFMRDVEAGWRENHDGH